jgi:hypothetical protein
MCIDFRTVSIFKTVISVFTSAKRRLKITFNVRECGYIYILANIVLFLNYYTLLKLPALFIL